MALCADAWPDSFSPPLSVFHRSTRPPPLTRSQSRGILEQMIQKRIGLGIIQQHVCLAERSD